MSRPLIVAGNWKMHGTRESVTQLLKGVSSGNIGKAKTIVFPPFVYLTQAQQALKDSSISWGGQNVCEEAQGAYTGEISANMLKEWGCDYVLVGHSERRQLYKETNEQVAKKFAQAQLLGITPILCVGETLEQYEQGATQQIVLQQIDAILTHCDSISCFSQGIIAYEPVWAIGTGKTATPEQAQAVHAVIRNYIAKHDAQIAQQLPILYGGSVKPDNASNLFAMSDIDGGLIGGASLKADDFLAICQAG